ncbi:MAG: ABC transporter permease subunit, partial [Kiritimatiellia bacterium]|nr:ABC transporter permease subunit [Kiritimatiellia bacterium]
MTPRVSVLRQIGLIFRQEMSDALRSRRAAVVLLLYLAAATLTMNGSLSLLQRLESELASVLQLPASAEPGVVTQALWKSERFRNMVARAAGSTSLVAELVGLSPIVLIYAGLAFFYTPFLAVLVAAPRLSEDLSHGSVRFVVSRAPRGAWSAGKGLAQVGLIAFSLLMGAAGAWIVARFRMPGADALELALGFASESGRALIYTLPFIGLAVGISQTTRSPNRAIGFGLALLFMLGILAWACSRYEGEGWAQIWTALRRCLPQAYRMDLWSRAPPRFIPAAVA